MNWLRHILFILIIGFVYADCPEGTTFKESFLSNENICVPNDFSSVNQSQQQAFYIFTSVSINGTSVSEEDWVGAFNGDVCVGARKWETSGCGGGICDVPVMGNDGNDYTEGYMAIGDIPTFKIFDISHNIYYNAESSQDVDPFTYNGNFLLDSLNVSADCTGILGGTAGILFIYAYRYIFHLLILFLYALD